MKDFYVLTVNPFTGFFTARIMQGEKSADILSQLADNVFKNGHMNATFEEWKESDGIDRVFAVILDGEKAKRYKIIMGDAKHTGVYQCFHCGSRSVVWDCDYDFEDMGYEGEGIVNCCHCTNCGADIEYRIPIPNENEEEEQTMKKEFIEY